MHCLRWLHSSFDHPFVSRKEKFRTCRIRGIKFLLCLTCPRRPSPPPTMLSVASLLNPAKPEPRGTRLPSSPTSSLCTTSSTYGSPLIPQSTAKKQKMTKDGAVFTKGKIKGEVNYPPFERLDEETLREVQKFQVYPLGQIQDFCRHIPYNSEKKNFLEKTGRESFEGMMA